MAKWQLLFARVDYDDSDECWIYDDWATNNAGYPCVSYKGKAYGCHVLAYLRANKQEKIPKGFEIAHLCNEKLCWNPKHLVQLTVQAHRKMDGYLWKRTHCPQGHPYDGVNSYTDKWGQKCRICRRLVNKEYMRQIRASKC